ncbi:hypothetical protein DL93DRAFT_2084948 [Clavulina sp. PMI_390]|nr:hypothetical protein DL93DRAFT_2084948 [Clavulina sp. PMI_390]
MGQLHTLQIELASETPPGVRRTNTTIDMSNFPARTLQILETRIGPPLDSPSEMVGANTGAQLNHLTMTRELVGGNEAWYRARVQEFAVVEKVRILPY